jgi:hypothetical protein
MNQPHIEPGYILNFVRIRRDIRIRKWFPEPDTTKSYNEVYQTPLNFIKSGKSIDRHFRQFRYFCLQTDYFRFLVKKRTIIKLPFAGRTIRKRTKIFYEIFENIMIEVKVAQWKILDIHCCVR